MSLSLCELRPISDSDLHAVMDYYKGCIGTPGCTWNEYYPNVEILQEDFSIGNLFGLYQDSMLIGAISVSKDNYLEKLPCWQFQENVREIARVVIAPQYQGQHHGHELLRLLFDQLRNKGTKAIHLLVSPENTKALKLYQRHGFINRGKFYLYEHDYFAFEAKI